MNTIIWLLYLADVVNSLSVLLFAGAGATLFGCLSYLFIAAISNDTEGKDLPLLGAVRPYALAAVIALTIGCVLPSKETIYAAAAVSAGEKALNTPTGDKAVRALNAWLDRQIAADGKKDK